ncbi:DNA dC-_dU-editing enzyme APOBEC-3F isoform X4 [Pongo pygmaeus]|uniref:DNA dC->dU-editing enzyme APOBEC-3F isoform X4 n=1 Tax=Pongo pygmaeus TaxID=9600 RepID=UPI00300C2BFD
MNPQFRNTVERMYRGTFFYNFNNRPILSHRNTVWLCYEVKTKGPSRPPLNAKIFRGQVYFEPPYHAEMCFLSWFCGNQLPAYKRFQITWFVSWTPCPDCVAKLAEFLAEHPNVTLTVSTARLYYYWERDYRGALRRLRQAGAHVKIMDYEGERWRGQGIVSGRNSMKDGWICNAMAGGVPGQPAGAGPAPMATDSQETRPGSAGPGSGQSLTASCLFISDFAYCWENFVYNEGQPFMPWYKFDANYAFLHHTLKEILRWILRPIVMQKCASSLGSVTTHCLLTQTTRSPGTHLGALAQSVQGRWPSSWPGTAT